MLLSIFNDDGSPIDAHFRIETAGTGWHLFLESRGGAEGKRNQRNSGYGPGFRLLIERIARLGLTITDGFVDTLDAGVRVLSEDERRLQVPGLTFPLVLHPDSNLDAVIRLLRQGQRDVGSERIKGGGNTTRRIRLVLNPCPGSAPVGDLGAQLSNGSALGAVAAELIEAAGREMDYGTSFDPTSLVDARRRILASIAARQGQPRFRRKVLRAYGGQCAVTACDVEAVLEAAHIVPYLGTKTNHVQNALHEYPL